MPRCFFCQHNVQPHYRDIDNLSKFLTARMKITPRERSGLCAKCQRQLAKHIKYARFLGLLPYISYRHRIK